MLLDLKFQKVACHIICMQETKRERFDSSYLKKFCPKHLDAFAFSPSAGVSGGLITIWIIFFFSGTVIQSNSYDVSMSFTRKADHKTFLLTNVYGPSHSSEKFAFITWLINFDTSNMITGCLQGTST